MNLTHYYNLGFEEGLSKVSGMRMGATIPRLSRAKMTGAASNAGAVNAFKPRTPTGGAGGAAEAVVAPKNIVHGPTINGQPVLPGETLGQAKARLGIQ